MNIINYVDFPDDNLSENISLLVGECQLYMEALEISSSKLYGESTMATIVSYIKKLWAWIVKVWKMITPIIDKLFGTSFSSSSSTGGGGAYGAAPTHSNELVANPKYCKTSHGETTNIGTVINFNINVLANDQNQMKPIGNVLNTIRTALETSGYSPRDVVSSLGGSLKEVLDNIKLTIDYKVLNECVYSLDSLALIPNKREHGYDLEDAYKEYSKFFLDLVSGMMMVHMTSDGLIENDISSLQILMNRGHMSLVLLQSAIPTLRDPKRVSMMFSQITQEDHVKVPIFKACKDLETSMNAFIGYRDVITKYAGVIKSEAAKEVDIAKAKDAVNDYIRRNLAADINVSLDDLKNAGMDKYQYIDFVITKIFTDSYEIEKKKLESATLLKVVYSGAGHENVRDFRVSTKAVRIGDIKPKHIFDDMYSYLWSLHGVKGPLQKGFKDEIANSSPELKGITGEDLEKYKDLGMMFNLYLCLFDVFAKVHRNIFKCACIEYLSKFYILNMEVATEIMRKLGRA